MDRVKISINEMGMVTVPGNARMTIDEIANLFGIFHQSAKRHIRIIEKSGIADGDYSMSCTVQGQIIYPDFYGLDMVVAVAFRVQSPTAEVFRRWVVKKLLKPYLSATIMLSMQNDILS